MSTAALLLLGAAIPPVAVGAVLAFWAILTEMTRWFVRVTTLMSRRNNKVKRAQFGAMMFAADRAWIVRAGNKAGIVVMWGGRSVDDREYVRSRTALEDLAAEIEADKAASDA